LTSAPYMHALSALRGVQYLTVDVRAIFEHAATVAPHSSFLAHVTHLELLELVHLSSEDTDRICSHLALIPDLTHVAFNTRLFDNVSHTGLHADARLKCIAFLSARRHALKETSPLLHDSRFVWIQQDSDYRLDWLRGAVTGEDYWAIADAFIAARRLGEVDRTSNFDCDSQLARLFIPQDRDIVFPIRMGGIDGGLFLSHPGGMHINNSRLYSAPSCQITTTSFPFAILRHRTSSPFAWGFGPGRLWHSQWPLAWPRKRIREDLFCGLVVPYIDPQSFRRHDCPPVVAMRSCAPKKLMLHYKISWSPPVEVLGMHIYMPCLTPTRSMISKFPRIWRLTRRYFKCE
jgi:hypothetical protein